MLPLIKTDLYTERVITYLNYLIKNKGNTYLNYLIKNKGYN